MQLAELKAQIEAADTERNRYKTQWDQASAENGSLSAQISKLDADTAKLSEEARDCQGKLKIRKVEVQQTKENIFDLAENQRSQRMHIGKLEEERDGWLRRGEA